MRRAFEFLVRNWPLKLAAVGLATLLYGGVVLSESTRTWPAEVPIDIINPPADAAVLTVLPSLKGIEYRASIDVASRLTNGSFQAFVDLSRVQPVAGGPEIPVAVQLRSVDDGVQIIDYGPKTVNVRVEPVDTRDVPVTVDMGIIPGGLDVGPPRVEPAIVTLRGASTRLMSVRTATARIAIDASAINVDQEVDIVPLDDSGSLVPGVVSTPARVRVRIDVAEQSSTATVPVEPRLVGELVPGYLLGRPTADPLTVTARGEVAAIEQLSVVPTVPIDLSGRTESFEVEVPLDPPPEVTLSTESVRVTVEIVPAQGSRTFESGLTLLGARPDLMYSLSAPSVLVTLSGTGPLLDALDVATVLARVDVAELGPGSHEAAIRVTAPPGLIVGSVAPETVIVEIASLPAGASPVPGPPGSPTPTP
ncbi:MAG: hypothetical protein H0V04_05585 [Chloroflexi bacterium]|nr:hypothetical protein [Chloroflexota bacterium]